MSNKPSLDITVSGYELLKDIELIVTTSQDVKCSEGPDVTINEPIEKSSRDDIGEFESTIHSFVKKLNNSKGDLADAVWASLEIKEYPKLGVSSVRASCTSADAFSHDRAVRIELGFIPGLKSALAIQQVNEWWTKPWWGHDLSNLPEKTQMILWQNEEGLYGCLIPLVSGGYTTYFNSRTGKVGADISSYDSGRHQCEAMAFITGVGSDPYELIGRCISAGMIAIGSPGKLRWQKDYPEPLEYIGWCTWDALYDNQNEKDIVKKLKAFNKAKFPTRWLLIDDGWSQSQDWKLTGFDVDHKKFPRGLKPLVDDATEKHGLWWVGVWHNYMGYWYGIEKDSDVFNRNKERLIESKKGYFIPSPDAAKGFAFWNKWHSWMREQGISFVKVDNQGSLHRYTTNIMPIGDAGKGMQYAVQASVGLNMSGLMINCMSQTGESYWNYINSNICRTSTDFEPKEEHHTAENHALYNSYNSLLYSNFAWPDWDMFWSCDSKPAYHAALRAVSGGPIYVSDPIDRSNFDVLWPLIFSDGKLLRCDEPGIPTRDCLLIDPEAEQVPLKVWNTIGNAGILTAFNTTDGEQAVKGSFKPSQVERLEAETYAVREFFTDETRVMSADEAWEMEIEPHGQRLFTIAPIEDGVAIIGLSNKYISPAAVEATFRDDRTLAVELYEGGDFLAYSELTPSTVTINGQPSKFSWKDGWLTVKCKPGEPTGVTITF